MIMKPRLLLPALAMLAALAFFPVMGKEKEQPRRINIDPPAISTDQTITYDYDIVYVRTPRWVEEGGRKRPARWAEFGHPLAVTPGSDLMLLHPDGSEELLVQGGEGAIQDPYVSFDGQWIYYTRFHQAGRGANQAGADIYKIHVKTRKIVRLTQQQFTTNKEGTRPPYGVYNMHPCPVPGGRVAFVSNRNGFLPPPKSYPTVALQLHIMDEDGSNVETIGHLNLAGALHPVILADGRLVFASLENMGLRNGLLWGIWAIHPDGTHWAPVVSAFSGTGAPSAYHFQTQLSDKNLIVELYYNQNQKGFGTLFKLPAAPPPGQAPFGPGALDDPRNPRWTFLGPDGGRRAFQMAFTPHGMEPITPWVQTGDQPAPPSNLADPRSPRIGKVTHPCGAPDNHLLVAWTLGPIGGSAGAVRGYMGPQPIDSGIYLIKNGKTTQEPGEMVLIKNDPKFNEQWPRPLVPYKRTYGVAEPKQLVHHNDGKASAHLPEGTPFGLVGTSSLYKRESAPLGVVPPGSVTAVFPKDYKEHGRPQFFSGSRWNWRGQGADAGRYDNSDIHAIRILAFEPNAQATGKGSVHGYPAYQNHPMERLRILGEIPVRKFEDGKQAIDPDGNPDTSFLARIPADVAFTFQTLDKDGMVLNMAQTWHQLRPGEIRNDCGGCHAHSQKPTPFEKTLAARPDYPIFDLARVTPLLTSKARDESGKQWDRAGSTGLRFVKGPQDVEYHRDIQPIFQRSCVACHTRTWAKPAAGLVLDDDETTIEGLPGTYFRLTADRQARFGPKPLLARSQYHGWQQYLLSDNASRYICKLQSRRSLLAWKIHGQRLDGFTNEDIASKELALDDPRFETMTWQGKPLPKFKHHLLAGDIDYMGSEMPPREAVEGGYRGPAGQRIKVAPLSDEDRRTIVRWIDLGCPIDLHPEYDPKNPDAQRSGYLGDDQRPTLTVTAPCAGGNEKISRILVGMDDYNAGLDLESFTVTADFEVNGTAPGGNLAPAFRALPDSRWELTLSRPITRLPRGKLTFAIKDRAGNLTRIERTVSVPGR
jgi:hypothetical protein